MPDVSVCCRHLMEQRYDWEENFKNIWDFATMIRKKSHEPPLSSSWVINARNEQCRFRPGRSRATHSRSRPKLLLLPLPLRLLGIHPPAFAALLKFDASTQIFRESFSHRGSQDPKEAFFHASHVLKSYFTQGCTTICSHQSIENKKHVFCRD